MHNFTAILKQPNHYEASEGVCFSKNDVTCFKINFNCFHQYWHAQQSLFEPVRALVVVIVWWLDLQLHMQSVPITTKVVSSNLAHGEAYLTELYVTKVDSDIRQIGGFLPVIRFPPPIKLTATI